MSTVSSFHAHVYFTAETIDQATDLCELAARTFDLKLGRIHKKPVGPHPMWSCQLAFAPQVFGDLIPWLALHRDGLIVFVHPETGHELADHTDHAIWMGEIKTLDVSVLD